MLSKLAKILLSVLLCVGTSFSASAAQIFSVASASNATSSNAFVADRLDIELYSVFNTTNTVDYSGVEVWLQYYDESLGDGILKYSKLPLSSNGVLHTNVYNTSRYDLVAFDIRLRKSSLPPAGKYKFTFDYSADIGPLYWHNSGTLGTKLSYNNASTQFPSISFTASRYGDDYGFKANVDIPSYSSDDFFFFVIPIDWSNGGGAAFHPEAVQWGGKLNFNFERLKSDSQVEFSPSDYGDSADSNDSLIAQSSQQIADNTAQIVQGQNQVIEEIQALVQHISDQLFALWEQIYSGIWQPHERLMNQILQAIRDVDVEVSASLSSVVSAIDKQTTDLTTNINKNVQEIQSNIDKNTDSLKNDYNNSSMTSDNEKLNNSLSEYEKAEEELFTDAKENINNFEYDSSIFVRYVRVFEEISNFLQQIYVTLGALNIPIGFSLTLSVALLFIGYYRFKGGT